MDRTLSTILGQAIKTLDEFGIDNPKFDARALLSFILECDPADLHTQRNKKLTEGEHTNFQNYIERRCRMEPVAYIIGYKDFCSIPIMVSPDVLIPRPETEMLVDQTLEVARNYTPSINTTSNKQQSKNTYQLKILDLCTGSGCITVVLAKELPTARFTVTDISQKALSVAKKNLSPYQGRVKLLQSNLYDQLEEEKFDIIVSNPPYLTTERCKTLGPEIADYEPMIAIDGGDDGRSPVDLIIKNANQYLIEGGFLVLEWGPKISTVTYDELMSA